MDIVWKGIVGGVVTAAVALLAKQGPVLPGIVPLFPTFGLIALYLVGSQGDQFAFRQTCLAGVKTLPAYLAFLLVSYLAIRQTGYRTALLLGLAAWLVCAVVTFALVGEPRQ